MVYFSSSWKTRFCFSCRSLAPSSFFFSLSLLRIGSRSDLERSKYRGAYPARPPNSGVSWPFATRSFAGVSSRESPSSVQFVDTKQLEAHETHSNALAVYRQLNLCSSPPPNPMILYSGMAHWIGRILHVLPEFIGAHFNEFTLRVDSGATFP
jgi:hypothetical protein